jgi:hypothetical protein
MCQQISTELQILNFTKMLNEMLKCGKTAVITLIHKLPSFFQRVHKMPDKAFGIKISASSPIKK